jgi:hypothetical protein
MSDFPSRWAYQSSTSGVPMKQVQLGGEGPGGRIVQHEVRGAPLTAEGDSAVGEGLDEDVIVPLADRIRSRVGFCLNGLRASASKSPAA